LLAGGIGITPIIAMAEQLARQHSPFELHYGVRSAERGAYTGDLKAKYGPRVHVYRDDAGQQVPLAELLDQQPLGTHLYICGPPGIGKSRLALQLAIKSALGQGFLGWETQAEGIKWALLQNENGQRRLKADLRVMVQDMTTKEREILDKNILIHSIVTDVDGHLDSDPEARKRVRKWCRHMHVVIMAIRHRLGAGIEQR
jgi:hypothetical protein